MKKISYNNVQEEPRPRVSQEIPTVTENIEPSPGAAGYVNPGEQALAIEDDARIILKKKEPTKKLVDHSRLSDLLVGLADGLDDSGEYAFASFADFLISKVAEQKHLDYEYLLKELVVKVSKTDIRGKNGFMISVAKEYSSKLSDLLSDGVDKAAAHREAYLAASEKVYKYVQ